MLSINDLNLRTLLYASAAALTLGCSADAASPDARPLDSDARDQPRADARPFESADAAPPSPDAMPGCVDSSEPNDSSAAAFLLAADPVDDNDVIETFIGAAMDADEDWYTYLGDDGGLTGVVDPEVIIVSGAVNVCMYLDCVNNGAQSFDCPNGTTDDTNGDLTGCCATTGFTIGNLSCSGSEDANVYIRVMASGASVCESYSINWHY